MRCFWNWTRSLPPKERGRFVAALVECSDELREVVLRMLSIIENPQSTPSERKRAIFTIADALFLNPDENDGEYGIDLGASEPFAAAEYPNVAHEVQKMDGQEATFADRLGELMTAKRLSQQELAGRVGCSQPAVSLMLSRKCRPQKKTILKLAEALDVDPRELWPDLEVAEMLDAAASFQQDDYVMTEAEARALRDTSRRNKPAKPVRLLPKPPR
jgi:transcriptional regulator with XRE-family HTH domain